MKPKVVVIVGPTASGKTKLSVELAKRNNGEIISADSMQIYKDMDIGTAKVTEEEKQGIKHFLVDFVLPSERYTVSNFKKDCENSIEEILKNGKTPIIVGGTGLYVDSIVYGIDYPEMKFDEQYRQKLIAKAETEEGLIKLWNEANNIDPVAMKKISKNDKKRIIRVLEIFHSTGKTKTEQELLSRSKEIKYDFRVFGIQFEREVLYERINKRVDIMIEQGLEQEVRHLISKYNSFPTAMQGLGYKEVVEYIDGKITYSEMIDKIKQETRRYAKRQMTWFRKNKDIIWLDGNNEVNKNVDIIMSTK